MIDVLLAARFSRRWVIKKCSNETVFLRGREWGSGEIPPVDVATM